MQIHLTPIQTSGNSRNDLVPSSADRSLNCSYQGYKKEKHTKNIQDMINHIMKLLKITYSRSYKKKETK